MTKKTNYCNTCSFNNVCEYKSDTKRFCVDRNDAKLDMSNTELRTRLLNDRKTELSSAIGLLTFLSIVGLFLFIACIPNAIISIFYLAMFLATLASALMLFFAIVRSVLVIITHIKRKFTHA